MIQLYHIKWRIWECGADIVIVMMIRIVTVNILCKLHIRQWFSSREASPRNIFEVMNLPATQLYSHVLPIDSKTSFRAQFSDLATSSRDKVIPIPNNLHRIPVSANLPSFSSPKIYLIPNMKSIYVQQVTSCCLPSNTRPFQRFPPGFNSFLQVLMPLSL